jgi:class 3 adenylate cyclase
MPNAFSTRFCRKCLTFSLSVEQMNRFAKMTNPDYDLYKSYGLSKGHPISVQEAADRIVGDMVQNGHYIDFVETLVKIEAYGYMGRKFPFRGLDDVINDLRQAGFSHDKTTGQFFEDQNKQITRNWGRLLEGDERHMAVLWLDVAGSTVLVKDNPKTLIDKAYSDLREIVNGAVVSRLGRLWTWEGDGALGVFMLGDYGRSAIFAAMEIINEMYMYNKTDNPLNSPVKLRIAVHSGHIVYSDNAVKSLKADTIQAARNLESSAAAPNSLVVSESLAISQDQALLNIFSDPKVVPNSTDKYRNYQVYLERRTL